MFKYFNNCKDITSLKKEYIRLMKKYHPDLSTDENEIKYRTKICAEINSEYDTFVKIMPLARYASTESENTKNNTIYNEIINNSIAAKKAVDDIIINIQKPNIDYKFYYVTEGVIWQEENILAEINATISIFWENCYNKQIVGDEFAKLYELCQENAEKMKRTIMFLSTGAISDKDIHANLQSEKSIPFLNDAITVDNLPDYSSFLLLSRDNTKKEIHSAWIEFCQKQRDDFLERYSEFVVEKIIGR